MWTRGWAVVLAAVALPAYSQQGESPRAGTESSRPAERDDLIVHAQKAMDELKAAVEELKKRADKASGEAKGSLDQQLRSLQDDQKKLERRLQELKAITAQQWRQLQEEIERALQQFRQPEPKPKGEAI
jgi:cob(I)alamin adenosyltransferase